MGIDAFVLRYRVVEEDIFAPLFLASADFNIETLRGIVRGLGITVGRKQRNELIDLIAPRIDKYNLEAVPRMIIEHLVARKREWLSLKMGCVEKYPVCDPPGELVLRDGKEQWYGPVTCRSDDIRARWYIRPVLISHLERRENDVQLHRTIIRWLCFARVVRDGISLHWRGFSYTPSRDSAATDVASIRHSQFPYWNRIPRLFNEIEELARAKVRYVDLHKLMLHQLWDQYQDAPGYQWAHRRIRAESSGVSLSAHAGAIYDIEAGGILHLARTVRKAVQSELASRYTTELPTPSRFDQVIMRTLIREYGALSYEFSLEKDAEFIFRAHSYFGLKETANSPDRFPHLRLFVSKRHNLEQLNFLLEYLRTHPSDEDFEPKTLRLF